MILLKLWMVTDNVRTGEVFISILFTLKMGKNTQKIWKYSNIHFFLCRLHFGNIFWNNLSIICDIPRCWHKNILIILKSSQVSKSKKTHWGYIKSLGTKKKTLFHLVLSRKKYQKMVKCLEFSVEFYFFGHYLRKFTQIKNNI